MGIEEEVFAMGLAARQAKRNATRKRVTLILLKKGSLKGWSKINIRTELMLNGQSVHKAGGDPGKRNTVYNRCLA